MKKIMGFILAVMLVFSSLAYAANAAGPMGPAPNAGDGISDGSGLDAPNGSNGDLGNGDGPMGPAPNSGDGIPDGSGF